MNDLKLKENTIRFLEESLPGNQDIDTKVRILVEGEFLRRLAAYHHTDRALARKYGISFDEFVSQHVVKQKGFAWDVESDAMAWDMAISGIKTLERKLRELRQAADEQSR